MRPQFHSFLGESDTILGSIFSSAGNYGNTFFGLLYDKVSPQAAFLSGAAFALAGLVLIYTLPVFPVKRGARA